jgi:MYXO-CTERM domain-containing protein
VATASEPADAHFRLTQPPQMTAESNNFGDPQKFAPCGPLDLSGADLTNEVTTYTAGETITITIQETINHPGHYRVALATGDPNDLPAAPAVTSTPEDDCAMTTVQNPPVYPVLADGMLDHDTSFNMVPQSFEVTLPDDVECTNCTLQVIEYMSSHSAPCFYYHCATINIEADPNAGGTDSGDGTTTDDTASTTDDSGTTGAGTTSTTGDGSSDGGTGVGPTGDDTAGGATSDTGTGSDTDSVPGGDDAGEEGCSCASGRGDGRVGLGGLALLVVAALRRRRR